MERNGASSSQPLAGLLALGCWAAGLTYRRRDARRSQNPPLSCTDALRLFARPWFELPSSTGSPPLPSPMRTNICRKTRSMHTTKYLARSIGVPWMRPDCLILDDVISVIIRVYTYSTTHIIDGCTLGCEKPCVHNDDVGTGEGKYMKKGIAMLLIEQEVFPHQARRETIYLFPKHCVSPFTYKASVTRLLPQLFASFCALVTVIFTSSDILPLRSVRPFTRHTHPLHLVRRINSITGLPIVSISNLCIAKLTAQISRLVHCDINTCRPCR
ncbi:hypothetical protein F4679DRAFT_386648 [Xylaria curta]|nr:hypothetical protein F4679DRAFT_386648 [Xylaria curta]